MLRPGRRRQAGYSDELRLPTPVGSQTTVCYDATVRRLLGDESQARSMTSALLSVPLVLLSAVSSVTHTATAAGSSQPLENHHVSQEDHQVSFTGYQVLRVSVTGSSTVELLQRLQGVPGEAEAASLDCACCWCWLDTELVQAGQVELGL